MQGHIFAHADLQILTRCADDRYMLRQLGIDQHMIDAGTYRDDRPQIRELFERAGWRLPDHGDFDLVRISGIGEQAALDLGQQ